MQVSFITNCFNQGIKSLGEKVNETYSYDLSWPRACTVAYG